AQVHPPPFLETVISALLTFTLLPSDDLKKIFNLRGILSPITLCGGSGPIVSPGDGASNSRMIAGSLLDLAFQQIY
ncbi:MAG TPA: hypothetical protein VFY41_05560, partial [Nitrososphaeraceae archaeon]|nr:hypothetical protein [Nitrososphaeraceae archaeon]